jgi:WD40 repeat protein
MFGVQSVWAFANTTWSANWSPDGEQVVTGEDSGNVRLWDVGGRTASSDKCCLDGRWILTSDRDDKVSQVWNATTLEKVGRPLETGLIVSATSTPDGEQIVTAGTDRTVRVWEVTSGELDHELPTSAAVSAVAVSPDGRWVVAGSSDGTTHVWDAATGQILAVMRMHADSVNAVDVSDDGTIVTASEDRTAKIYGCSTCVSVDELIARAKEHVAIGA